MAVPTLDQLLDKILYDQFQENRGLRPEVDGLPRILIALTDGQSHDSVSTPAQRVRENNIVIYAIGIGGYNLNQLNEIASSKSHVYTLSDFDELQKFITTITSSTCYEPSPVSLGNTVNTSVSSDVYQYFSYNVDATSNMEINVVDLQGSTLVYASRTNPHPYKYDNDIAFDLSQQKNKIIVISARLPNPVVKRSTDDGNTRQIYVSVTSDTDSASFTIEGNECNPLNCTEGTNEMPARNRAASTQNHFSRFVVAMKFMLLSIGILMMFF